MRYIGPKISQDDLNLGILHVTASREGGVMRLHAAIGKQYILLNYKERLNFEDNFNASLKNYIAFECKQEEIEFKKCLDALVLNFKDSGEFSDGFKFGFDEFKKLAGMEL